MVCPDGYYPNKVTHTCDLCHYGCAICNGSQLTDCTVCKDYDNLITIVPYYKILDVNTCSLSCPTGQYINQDVPNVCAYCDPSCISCSITSTNCTVNACKTGFFYYALNSSCIKTCPNNYFAGSGLCTKCTDGC